MSFQYDCGGTRTRKIVDGVETRYYLKGFQIQTQITGNERLDFLHDKQEQLLGVQTGEETFYYVRNMQQDIIGILDKEGTRIVFYSYDSRGKLVAVTGNKTRKIAGRRILSGIGVITMMWRQDCTQQVLMTMTRTCVGLLMRMIRIF